MKIPHPKNGSHEDVRLLFDIVAGENGPVDYCIRKLYCPKGDGYDEFFEDREAFFTDEEYSEIEESGRSIGPLDLEGMYVDLRVVTKKVKGFKLPYSSIAGIFYPGTLIQDPDCEGSPRTDKNNDDEPSRLAA